MKRFARLFCIVLLALIPVAAAACHWRHLYVRAGYPFATFARDGVMVGIRESSEWDVAVVGPAFFPRDEYFWPWYMRLGHVRAMHVPWLWLVAGWGLVTAAVFWFTRRLGKRAAFPVELK